MAIVCDSTVLIVLTKIGRLELLRLLYRRVLIPPSVYDEVVTQGKRMNKPGVEETGKAIQSGWIRVVKLTGSQDGEAQAFRASGGIGGGEAEAIALAHQRKLPVVLDDKFARRLAASLGLKFIGTAGLLLEACWSEALTKGELKESVRDLGKVMWLSPDVVAELMRLADEEAR